MRSLSGALGGGGLPVRFRLLGPFEVLCGRQPLKVGGLTRQAVLVALLQHPNRARSRDELVRAVWGAADAVGPDSFYHYVSGLRRMLEPVGVAVEGRSGYRIVVDPARVDAVEFADLVTGARSLRESDPQETARRLRRGLDLWRGPTALPGLTAPGIRRYAAGLDGRRLDAEEDLAAVELDFGHADVVLDRLRTLAASHPKRAGLTAALMRALYDTGRTDEALALYQRAHRRATSEGRQPDDVLRQAQQDVLRGRRSLRRSSPAPFQVPPDTAHFTGRTGEVSQLLNLWPGDEPATTLVVSATSGMAGIGKTALAVHVAHQMAERFPDGVLFCDLRGFTPGIGPVTPDDALDYLLRGLGASGSQIPADRDSRVATYRTVLSGRRVLVVLDNAASEAQVRPLLPGTPGCLVLVTSRRRLAGLDDAEHVILDILPAHHAVTLFTKVAGDRVTTADHRIVEQIVARCGHLPLAIRIAAARLRISRTATPERLLDQLRAQSDPLAALEDGERSVRAAFTVSYQHLTDEQRHALRGLGLHPGADTNAAAAAAVLDTTVGRARQLLDDLEQVNLLDQYVPDRYMFHDLTRAFAAATVAAEVAEADRHVMLTRLFDHYLHTSSAAMDRVYPWESRLRPRFGPVTTHAVDFDRVELAEAWLDAEMSNMTAAAAHAAEFGWPAYTMNLSTTVHRHLRTRGQYAQAEDLHSRALAAARTTGNRTGEMTALTCLGNIRRTRGEFAPAITCLQQAAELAREAGDRDGELSALTGLGDVHWLQGRYAQATDCHTRALNLARAARHRPGEMSALSGLGHLSWIQCRYDLGATYYRQALKVAQDIGHRGGELQALNGIGHVHRVNGEWCPALDSYQQALLIARDTGHRGGELNALAGIAHVHRMRGEHSPATEHYSLVLSTARDIGHRNYEFEALHGLGRIQHTTDHPIRALDQLHQALVIAEELHHTVNLTRVHDALAYTHLSLGNPEKAREHWRRALAYVTAPDATAVEDTNIADIHAHLAELNHHLHPPADNGL